MTLKAMPLILFEKAFYTAINSGHMARVMVDRSFTRHTAKASYIT
jgi:hypothetical protein